ncbi:hypothetical protein GCM10010403_28930 [Glycomyces rutgersensis]|uniref:Uncharacterized protein n=1 Tax=Glycomyces rutgersensis TaxID=58115 RepID=A0ABP5SN72_9ACTN
MRGLWFAGGWLVRLFEIKAELVDDALSQMWVCLSEALEIVQRGDPDMGLV